MLLTDESLDGMDLGNVGRPDRSVGGDLLSCRAEELGAGKAVLEALLAGSEGFDEGLGSIDLCLRRLPRGLFSLPCDPLNPVRSILRIRGVLLQKSLECILIGFEFLDRPPARCSAALGQCNSLLVIRYLRS